MDKNVEKVMKEILGEDDYDLVIEMLDAMDRTTRNPKDEIRSILEDAVDE